jgi:large subunit ribosomal protein L17
MRHRKKNPHLGRKRGHRKYMLANMGSSLIEHKSINTTLAKAKALKLFIEPIITKSKTDTTHNRRIAFKYLRNKYAVTELFREVAVKIGDRPGGYTRIIKLGNRSGDNADMAMIELVDYNELYSQTKPDARKRRRRKKKSNEKLTTSESALTQESPSEEEAPATEEAPAEKEAPATEEAPDEKEAPVAEEAPDVEEAPVAEEAPDVEVAPAAEESPDSDDKASKNKKEN